MASKNRTPLLSALCGSPVDGMVEIRVSGGAADGRGAATVMGAGSSLGCSSTVALGSGSISLNASAWCVGTAAGSDDCAIAGRVADTDSPTDSITAGAVVETVPGVGTGIDVPVGVLRREDGVLGCTVCVLLDGDGGGLTGAGVFVDAGVLVGTVVLVGIGDGVAAGTAVLVA